MIYQDLHSTIRNFRTVECATRFFNFELVSDTHELRTHILKHRHTLQHVSAHTPASVGFHSMKRFR